MRHPFATTAQKATCAGICGAVLGLLLTASCLSAQALPLKRSASTAPGSVCSADTSAATSVQVSDDDVAEARRLGDAAAQASIVGDLAGARDLLQRAVRLDPLEQDLRYRYARILEQLDDAEGALNQLCRYLAIAPEGADAEDVRQRVSSLAAARAPDVPMAALQSFRSGVASFDAGLLLQSEASFTNAIDVAPRWPEPYYDRGVVRDALGHGQAAEDDFRAYLTLAPSAPDSATVAARLRPPVLALPRARSGPAPVGVLLGGMVLPGYAQFRTHRPVGGAIVLGVAGGAVAFGLLDKQVKVQCLGVPTDGVCPPDQVGGEKVEHPYLLPAVGAAAAAALIGAIEGYLHASSAPNSGYSGTTDAAHGLSLGIEPDARSGVRLRLVRISF